MFLTKLTTMVAILWSRAERQRLLFGVVLCGDGVFRRAMWRGSETDLWSG